MAVDPQKIKKAVRHLRAADPVMREVIRRVGPCHIRLERDRFRMLVRSILSQQISTSAARAIRLRFEALMHPEQPTPQNVARLTVDELRGVGVSSQKATYLLDLAGRASQGTIRLRDIGRLSDEKAIAELTEVKGIGRWTAQMFLMFSLGRLDVFPHDDLGVRSAIRNLYGLDELPDKSRSHEIAAPWRPYASVASWYCWRSMDLEPETV